MVPLMYDKSLSVHHYRLDVHDSQFPYWYPYIFLVRVFSTTTKVKKNQFTENSGSGKIFLFDSEVRPKNSVTEGFLRISDRTRLGACKTFALNANIVPTKMS